MKQTFYVYEVVKSPNGQGKIKMFAQEVLSLRNDQFHNLLGTIELDVQPIKKEVEKVMENPTIGQDRYGNYTIASPVPNGAYNIKVTYTVKE